MRFIAFMYFILFIHVKASYLDDLRGAVLNVERGFEKLISDVVTDMKDTLDCTISAVGHVLYVSGIYKQPLSGYSERCIHSVKSKPNNYNVKNPDHRTLIQDTTILSDIVQETEHGFHKGVISQHLQSSISSANKTLFSIIDDRETTEKIKNVSETLRNETNHLSGISSLLRKELDKMSKDVTNKIYENNDKNTNDQEVKTNEHSRENRMDDMIKQLEEDITHKHHGGLDEKGTADSENIKKSVFNHESDVLDNLEHALNSDVVNPENHKEVVQEANKIIEDSRIADRLLGTR